MTQKIWSLYKITNSINSKVYIGQATNVSKRWSDHRRAAENNRPVQPIHYAMIKYGLNNFVFDNIASCRSQDDANWLETELVSQYDSFISNDKGYNATLGGMTAPKSEEWKAHMRIVMIPAAAARMAAETAEQKEARYAKISDAMKGRPRVPGSGKRKGYTGEISSRRKLTKEKVDVIREQNKQGFTSRQLAVIHDIHRSSISRILNGTYYKNF